MATNMRCQYCGVPTVESHTCFVCMTGMSGKQCRCENNSDFCDACLDFIEARQEQVEREEAQAIADLREEE